MKEAKISDWHIIVEGFRNVEIRDVDALFNFVDKEAEGCYVQFFDADLIAGFDHLYFAFLNASKAFEAGNNISKDVAVETLLFASGQRQISNAIKLIGIKPHSSRIAVLAVSKSRQKAVEMLDKVSKMLCGEKFNDVLELTDDKFEIIKKAFKISGEEIEAVLRKNKKEALTSLLIEHIALLATQR